jgi:signal transduction histidine kinase
MQGFKDISADTITETKRKFYLKKYLEEIILNIKPELKRTKIKVNIDCPKDLEVDTYPSSLFQVITILIMNSLTHGFDPDDVGIINITVAIANNNIVLTYADSGKGIAPENINKVFEPFFTTRRSKGNIGLGLHIAYEKIVQLLKGTISCESVLGKGATFTITFPRSLSSQDFLNQDTQEPFN